MSAEPEPGPAAPRPAATRPAAARPAAAPKAAAPRGRRRGRRPAGQETRDALLDAARVEFNARGFEGATVRVIAERAEVDPAMVNHWFGGKEGLFVAALALPVDPATILAALLPGDPEQLAARLIRTFLTVWDATGGGPLAALIRSVAGHDDAAQMMREFITRTLVGPVVSSVAPDDVELRMALCATQVIGLGMVRYVLQLEPLASADHETVVTAIAPNLQRYLTGSIDSGAPWSHGATSM